MRAANLDPNHPAGGTRVQGYKVRGSASKKKWDVDVVGALLPSAAASRSSAKKVTSFVGTVRSLFAVLGACAFSAEMIRSILRCSML